MRSSHPNLISESQRVAVRFLLIELSTGLTFLDVADTTCHRDNRERNIHHAHRVYATVRRFLPRVDLLPHEQNVIEKGLEELKRGLLEARTPAELTEL